MLSLSIVLTLLIGTCLSLSFFLVFRRSHVYLRSVGRSVACVRMIPLNVNQKWAFAHRVPDQMGLGRPDDHRQQLFDRDPLDVNGPLPRPNDRFFELFIVTTFNECKIRPHLPPSTSRLMISLLLLSIITLSSCQPEITTNCAYLDSCCDQI